MDMQHRPASDLKKELHEAESEVHIGARYSHFKTPSSEYVVIGLGILEETEDVAVIYQSQQGDNVTFIRPLSTWVEVVEYEGARVPRFSKIS